MSTLLYSLLPHLHSFLFNGDGRAIHISAASPSHSNGTPQAFLYSRSGSRSVESLAESDRSQSPSSRVPSPLNLSSHPSRRRSLHASEPIAYKMQYENTMEVDSSIASQQSSMRSETDSREFEAEMDLSSMDEGVSDMFGLDKNSHASLQQANSVPDCGSSIHMAPNHSLTTLGSQPSLRTIEWVCMMNPRSDNAKCENTLLQPAAMSGNNHEW